MGAGLHCNSTEVAETALPAELLEERFSPARRLADSNVAFFVPVFPAGTQPTKINTRRRSGDRHGPARTKDRIASLRHRRAELSPSRLRQATHLYVRSASGRTDEHDAAGAACRAHLRCTADRQKPFAGS